MNIKTHHVFPPIPDRRFDWSAIDADTYDGAPDSANNHQVGYGMTEESAIADLMSILAEDEIEEADACPVRWDAMDAYMRRARDVVGVVTGVGRG